MIKKQYALLAFLYLMVAAGCGNQESKTDLGESDVTFKVFVGEEEIQPTKGRYHVKAGQNVHIELEYTGRYKQYWVTLARDEYSDQRHAYGQEDPTDEHGKAVIVMKNFCGSKKNVMGVDGLPMNVKAQKGLQNVIVNMHLVAPVALSIKEVEETGRKVLYIPFSVE